MKTFNESLTEAYSKFLSEAELPQQSAAPAGAAPQAGGQPPDPAAQAAPAGGAPTPDMGGGEQPKPDLDDDTKAETDPMEFAESLIEKIPKLTPELFNKYLDTFTFDTDKIADKDSFKKFYSNYQGKMQQFLTLKSQLKDLFPQVNKMMTTLTNTKQHEPDTAGGGVDTGHGGPGVSGT